jgi:hypothetical protein
LLQATKSEYPGITRRLICATILVADKKGHLSQEDLWPLDQILKVLNGSLKINTLIIPTEISEKKPMPARFVIASYAP